MPFCVQNALETTLAVPPKTHWENNSVPQILLKDSRGEPKFRKKRKGRNKAKKGMQKEKTKQKKKKKKQNRKRKALPHGWFKKSARTVQCTTGGVANELS